MNHSEIVSFIWGVADLIRDVFKRGKYQDIILPLTVLRRLDCVLAPTKEKVLQVNAEYKDKLVDLDNLLRKASGFAFYNTSPYDFEKVLNDAPNIAANLRNYISGFSPNMREVVEKFDFDNTISKLDEAGLLFKVLERFKNVDLHPDVVDNATMGTIFEELIRRFNEALNENPGEHFTPRYQDCYVEEDRATGRFERGFISPRSLARIPYEGAPDDRSQPLKAPLTTGFWLGGKSCVGDLRVSFLVKPVVASGRLVVTIERQGELPGVPGTHSLVLPFSEAGKPLYRSPLGSDALPAECRLAPDRAVRVEFALWDGVVMVRIDGKTVFQKSYEPSGRELRGNSITLSLEGSAVADFDDLAVDKDIYYITVDAGNMNPWQTAPGRYHVPEGRYFVLGDNSPASSDCRYKMPPVPRDAIIGRAFAVIWPVRHWKFLPRGAK